LQKQDALLRFCNCYSSAHLLTLQHLIYSFLLYLS